MARIVLISCVSRKRESRFKAQDLYISPLFRKNLHYAKSLGADGIYVLSAKYGLLKLDDKVEPYDTTLNKMTSEGVREWSARVLKQLKKISDFDRDCFVFLAGNNYRKYLIPHIKNYEVPMLGLGIGRQLKWLNENTKDD